MGNRLLNETFVRQRSEELRIPFENLFAASVLEEIMQKIAESEYSQNFWMKNSMSLNLESYRKRVDLNLSFCVKESERFHYKKSDISNLSAQLFRNYKKEAVYWNYHVWMDEGKFFIDVVATLSDIKVPVKIKLEPVTQENLIPYKKDIQLFSNNRRTIQIYCFPSEYVISEKFLEVIDKLELLNDLSCYMDIYEILKKDVLSGRRVWEMLQEGCAARRIPIGNQRFEMLMTYRSSRFMEKKWKAYLKREKRKQPVWEDVMDYVERFFGIIWDHMCRNIVYLGDWMPELGRCIDS